MHYVSPINGYEKGHKQLIILKKRRKRTSLKNAVFVRQVVLFSTDEEKWGKSGRVRFERIGASETPSESGRMAAKRPQGALLQSKIK